MIQAVGPDATVPTPAGTTTERFPGTALLPGLINLHTHLELTSVGGPLREREFFDWLLRIKRTKQEADPDWLLASARQGVRDTWRYGTTTVADTGDSGAVVRALTDLGGAGLVYHEVFGPHPDQRGEAMTGLAAAVERLRATAGPRVRVGVSPHAPYTVSGELYRSVARYAREEGLPVAMHLAESRGESELVMEGRGPFAESWTARGIPLPEPATSPVDYVRRTGILECEPLIIHGVRVNDRDAEVLARAHAAVALCPASNRAHGHGDPPVATFRRAGLRWGVGTDSVASVGSLDLFREARLAVRLGRLAPADGLERLTVRAAEALGESGRIGALEPGAWGDVLVMSLPDDPGPDLPATILATGSDGILRTYGGGRCLYARSDPAAPSPDSST